MEHRRKAPREESVLRVVDDFCPKAISVPEKHFVDLYVQNYGTTSPSNTQVVSQARFQDAEQVDKKFIIYRIYRA